MLWIYRAYAEPHHLRRHTTPAPSGTSCVTTDPAPTTRAVANTDTIEDNDPDSRGLIADDDVTSESNGCWRIGSSGLMRIVKLLTLLPSP